MGAPRGYRVTVEFPVGVCPSDPSEDVKTRSVAKDFPNPAFATIAHNAPAQSRETNVASSATIVPASKSRGPRRILAAILDYLGEQRPGDRGHLALIRNRVKRVPGIPAGAVTVELAGGVATLRGEVPSPMVRTEVERAVRAVHPSRRITNLLTTPARSASRSS